MSLEKDLKTCGYLDGAATFRDILADVFAVSCPSWTDEELLCNPRQAVHYCDAVRARTCLGIPDRLILRALTNSRKNPAVARKKTA